MAETLEITRQAAIKAHDEASTKGKTLLENLFGKRVFQKDIKISLILIFNQTTTLSYLYKGLQ